MWWTTFKAWIKEYHNRVAIAIVVGLCLVIAHYQGQPFLKYLFFPQIGYAVLIGVVGIVLMYERKRLSKESLGPKYIWIPLAVIAGSAVLRLIVQQDMDTLAGALLMMALFGLYIISRQYGERALNLFMPLVIIGAVSIVIDAMVTQAPKNAGLFNNYATAAEFLVFGFIVSPRRHQWWLSVFLILGLVFSGAEEGIFYLAVFGAALLIRKDWGKRLLVPVGALVLLLVVGMAFGATQKLYARAGTMLSSAYQAVTANITPTERDALLNYATDGRWLNGWRVHRAIEPLGYGLEVTYHYKYTPHNIALLVADQLGPVASAAWIGGMVIGIRKTKWKYGFLGLLAFGVFQPFVWTEMAPYMWVMAGAATVANQSDYIFKKGE